MIEAFTFKNLYDAYLFTRIGKRDKKCVIRYELNALSKTMKLYEELSDKSYVIGDFHSFYVHEPKTRLIMAPH